jgi:hypothetical protein
MGADRIIEDQNDVRSERKFDLDLGEDHALAFTSWKPDRELNPQWADLHDVERIGAIVRHKRADGGDCWSGIYFDCPVAWRVFNPQSIWAVESWEPLTLSPSLLCRICGDHGWIKEGKWVRA